MTGTATVRWDGTTLLAALDGRATGEAIGVLRDALEEALERGRPFTVLFDRRRLGGPTADGRAALERWGDELTPRLPAGCLAWADLYDEKRAASLVRAAADGSQHEGPYPHRTFGDLDEARRWLSTFPA